MWDYCGMERSEEGLRKAIRGSGAAGEFWVDGGPGLGELNQPERRGGSPTSSSSAS
jgi:hypothetical protein